MSSFSRILYHPNKQFIKHIKERTYLSQAVMMSYFPMDSYDQEDKKSLVQHMETMFNYTRSDLQKDFLPVFGKHVTTVEGKYRKAQVYVFQYRDMFFMCAMEKGAKGTSWYTLDTKQQSAPCELSIINPFWRAKLGDEKEMEINIITAEFFSVLQKELYGAYLDPCFFPSYCQARLKDLILRDTLQEELQPVIEQKVRATSPKKHKI